ncbi:Dam family site-specific DNA-(adenine-N6)-methyltransferase [Clostridium butyricum]|uniref:Dam family site-specific DNA-(adenine-N6)-methyltransferase n=1 Tax=Clostridium butyricum TaxID=1492 RepID=UPI0021C30F38|nr:Dam family site-specific DNA-(adenine-N6)-methyltransferase [Clostridium butyricum]MCQ2013248.1 Dam family site-specific DNA-(adenine-N6)-methyltransferase [Clostridium butyricum]
MRYIGSKVNLLKNIEDVINENIKEEVNVFMDLFSGTGTVGEYFKKDYTIKSNDILYFSHILQKAKIENNEVPNFNNLREVGIEDALHFLETEPYNISEDYFITRNYSPYMECERMYFTVENAARIDFIRLKINEWKLNGLISDMEYTYILATLIEAVPFVSNISGTYGAYLKKWDKRALGDLKLRRIDVANNHRENKSYNEDSNKIIKEVTGDILYIDPPYNGRQYISNYHLLETIARYDSPDIYGVTGLRPYENEKSLYCLKKEVEGALDELIKNANFKHILLSYSTDGLLSEDEIKNIFIKYGIESTYKVYKILYRKYKSKHEQKDNELYEYIFYIQKDIKIQTTKKERKRVDIQKYSEHKYIKSPLNYIGGKYKLLNQIVPLFPNEINKFVDLFVGGFNVGINVNANSIVGVDINTYVLEVLSVLKDTDIDIVINHIEDRINEFNLSKENEEGFLRFREFYNENKNPLDLYTLICYSFNYQFRFNNNQEYNNPFGRNRSQFSSELRKKLIIFMEELKKKEVEFINCEFENFNFELLSNSDFVYCDPPYLITTGSYNDGNRGFKNWNEQQEYKLLALLDKLNDRGIKFALSNVLRHKGKENQILIDWAEKYNIHYLNHSYKNSSHNTKRDDSDEVLITNYTE